ncbi:MAG: CoA-binding protein [Desulfobacteraceae bacterium]|nr:MAG: CoA-binding protein [Desulfobacteraceae bacterium]
MEDYKQYHPFFYAKSIAVIGVSPEPANMGRSIVFNCLMFGYPGEVLSVGLRPGVVHGQRIYRSLDEIPREIELAVILTPAKTIPTVLEQCGRKGIKYAIIESAGFSELSAEAKPLEQACNDIAQKYGIRFIGPNCIGVTNIENGLAVPFLPLRQDLKLGPVSILSQSGGVGLSFLWFLADENMGVNKFISIGNKLNVDENDLLEYLIHDKGTRIILVYLEGFTNGRRFVEIASQSTKPILVYKSNRFLTSANIAHSHTTALFTDDKLVDHVLNQAGCIRLNTMDDALDYIKSQVMPPLKGNRLGIISRSGGHAVIAADACAYYGFQLANLPHDFFKKFKGHFRANVTRLQNPLDLGDLFELDFYEYIVEEMLKRDDIDGVILGHGYRRGYEHEASRLLLQKVEHLVEKYKKPVAPVILTEAAEIDYLKKNLKIPIFSAPENAMRAFNLSYVWASRKPHTVKAPSIPGLKRKIAQALLASVQGRNDLTLKESVDLFEAYGFPFPPGRFANRAEEAVQTWKEFGKPVALKLNRPHISHKTDAGAVRLNLDSAEQIENCFQDFEKAFGHDLEVLVQTMAPKGREVILGAKRDPIFGPIILFGLGGIFVEALEDVIWRVAPLDKTIAQQMLNGIKGRKVLDGLRGEKPYDKEALEDLLIRLSQLMLDCPQIQEIDLNPVMVYDKGQGAQALDARVILGA